MATKRIYVTKDASVALRDGTDSLGQGAGDNLVVGYGTWLYRSLLYFPVDFTDMTAISSATITLFAYSRSGQTNANWEYGSGMRIKRLTSSWSEGTKGADGIWWNNNAVAWANQPSATTSNQVTDTSTVGNSRPSHGKAYTFTITDIVKQWAPSTTVTGGGDQTNHGIRLEMVNETSTSPDSIEFCSREDNSINGGTSYDAYIDITYTAAVSVTNPINAASAPTSSKIATIVNLDDANNWTGATKLARPQLSWTFTPSTSTPAAQDEWRVRIYSASSAGNTIFDSGWVTDGSHAADTSVDIPLNISSSGAPHMPGGLTATVSNVTWSSNTATYTTSAAHGLDTGMYVNVTGLNESQLNISNAEITVTGSTTFTATASYPGAITGTSGTVSTIWASGYKGLVNNTNYWWTIQTRDVNGLEASESSRTQFKVLFSNQQLQYAYPGGTASTFVHNIGSTPAGTSVERLYGTTNTTGATPSTWYSSLSEALTNRGSNAYIVVAVRMGVLNNSNTAISDPTVSGLSLSYVAAVARTPDKWATSSANITAGLSDEIRRFGTQAAKITAVTAATHSIKAYRASSGDGVGVVPNTNYTFSFYVYAGSVSGTITGKVYAGSTLLATSDVHTAFDTDNEGWRRMYVSFHSGGNTSVEPYIYIDATATNTSFYVDGSMLEEGTVIRSYTPGLVNSPALVEGGGIQVDASKGGTFRLRGSAGLPRDVIQLGSNGLDFGTTSPVSIYQTADGSNSLTVSGALSATSTVSGATLSATGAVSGATLSATGTLTLGSSIIHQATDNVQEFIIAEAVSLAGRTASLATITTTYDHQLLSGQLVTVALTSGPTGYAALNGSWTIAVTGTTTFTYTTGTSGTITSGAAVGTVTTVAAGVQPHGLYIPTAKAVVFEGTTDNVLETFLVAAEATTTDKTITLPDATGTVQLTGQTITLGTDLTGSVTLANGAMTLNASVTDNSHNHTSSTISGLVLGTDVSGTYVAGITAGTGVSISGTAGAGWSPIVSIGQAVATTSNVTFANLSATGTVTFTTPGTVTLGTVVGDNVRITNLYQTTTITNSFNPRMYNGSGAFPWRFFYDTSSERFKTNIVYMEDTDAILDVNPVSYHDKADYEANGEESPRQYGFLAEDMASNPEGISFVVHNGADAETIQYERLVVPLFSAMRKLRSRIDELEARLAELETGA